MSNSTSYTKNTMLTTSLYHYASKLITPPLPERPPKIFEDPVYAVVE